VTDPMECAGRAQRRRRFLVLAAGDVLETGGASARRTPKRCRAALATALQNIADPMECAGRAERRRRFLVNRARTRIRQTAVLRAWRTPKRCRAALATALQNIADLWSAPAERSGDGAFSSTGQERAFVLSLDDLIADRVADHFAHGMNMEFPH
jgi:hypothetical protein